VADHSKRISKAGALRREIQRKVREVGIGETVKLGVRKIIADMRKLGAAERQDVHPFDLKYGTDTSGIIKPGALDIPGNRVANAVQYQSAIVEVFFEILNSLPIPFEKFLFIDLGSGKGRALLLASRYSFKGIIGVELSENLHRIACQNINIVRDELQKCHKIQSIKQDAASYQIPDENIVFYLFNPFDALVITEVLANIEGSFRRCPRDIYITYLKPLHREVFDRASFLEIFKETERFLIYRTLVQ
jgi:hypothetical protein